MLETFNTEYCSTIRWDTRSVGHGTTYSPTFHFGISEYCVQHYKMPSTDIGLYLHRNSKEDDPTVPSSVTVRVESRGRMLPSLTHTALDPFGSQGKVFWSKSVRDIVQADPDFNQHRRLTFLMTFKSKLLSTNSTDDNFACTLCKSLSPTSVPCLESLSEDFGKLMDQSSNPDVQFRCGDLSTKAHRLVVCSRSPVIASMMSSGMLESTTGIVNIPDMQPDTFQKFIKYLYTGKLDELSVDTALALYEAGDQYSVLGLAKRCSEFLLQHLTVQNACQVLVVADGHSNAVFKEAVVGFMVDKKVPQQSDLWPTFCGSHPVLAVEVLNRFCNAVTN